MEMEMEMELSTPNKNPVPLPPLSQFENSPVFNYINSLSPLELVKSIHSDHSFNSLSLSSPLRIFASPQLSSVREALGPSINRCQLAGSSKYELAGNDEDGKSFSDEGLEVAVKSSTCGRLEKEDGTKTPIDCEGLDGDIAKVPMNEDKEKQITGDLCERRHMCESEKGLRNICRIKQNEDVGSGDWVALISHVADVLNFESTTIEEPSEEPKMVDPGMISFFSDVLQIPQENTSTLEDMKSNCHAWSSGQSEMGTPGVQSIESGEQKERDQKSNILSDTLLDKLAVNGTTSKMDVKGKRSSSTQRIRRRCLVFEMAGAHKNRSTSHTTSTSSITSQTDVEVPQIEEKLSTMSEIGRGSPLPMYPDRSSIGLHLNALATTSSDGKEIEAITTDQFMENDPPTYLDIHDGFGFGSPKTKRHKLEHVGVACKRCNCKRSKCLKLYCECFAAGLYCIEPCSCRDCFNKPAHEETVLETRRQIESRNPLAFAPKVIRSMDSVAELGDETNKTPASARHKRGCNCKKSSCLKKYCECFQEGVGCSSNCRCEGCKNSFGSKNAMEDNEPEVEDSNAHEKNGAERTIHSNEEHPDLLMPPETPRSPIHLPINFKGQLSGSSLLPIGPFQIRTSQKVGKTDFATFCLPKFETNLEVIPEDECSEIQTNNRSSTSGVKSISPNCKRVSPPHPGFGSSTTRKSHKKLILRSVPPFPSLNLPTEP